MSNQRDMRGISAQSCIRVSDIAQKCIELQINIMLYAVLVGSRDSESITV